MLHAQLLNEIPIAGTDSIKTVACPSEICLRPDIERPRQWVDTDVAGLVDLLPHEC